MTTDGRRSIIEPVQARRRVEDLGAPAPEPRMVQRQLLDERRMEPDEQLPERLGVAL